MACISLHRQGEKMLVTTAVDPATPLMRCLEEHHHSHITVNVNLAQMDEMEHSPAFGALVGRTVMIQNMSIGGLYRTPPPACNLLSRSYSFLPSSKASAV